jgi:hypothetical protein
MILSAVFCEIKQCDISKLIIKEPNIGNSLINVFFASNCINELGNDDIELMEVYDISRTAKFGGSDGKDVIAVDVISSCINELGSKLILFVSVRELIDVFDISKKFRVFGSSGNIKFVCVIINSSNKAGKGGKDIIPVLEIFNDNNFIGNKGRVVIPVLEIFNDNKVVGSNGRILIFNPDISKYCNDINEVRLDGIVPILVHDIFNSSNKSGLVNSGNV